MPKIEHYRGYIIHQTAPGYVSLRATGTRYVRWYASVDWARAGADADTADHPCCVMGTEFGRINPHRRQTRVAGLPGILKKFHQLQIAKGEIQQRRQLPRHLLRFRENQYQAPLGDLQCLPPVVVGFLCC